MYKTSEYQVGLPATRGSLIFSRIVLKVDRTLCEIEADLQRQKLLVEASSKNRENHVMALQNRVELAQVEKQRERELAKAEADPEMKLTQQLAVEKQRTAILHKENEIQKLKFEIAQKTFEKEIRRKVSEETQQVPKFQQPAVTTSNFSHSAVQSDSVQSTPTLTSPHAQPSTSVQVSPVTQINCCSLSAVTEPKTIFDQTPMDLYACLLYTSPSPRDS